jgi:hypothetical protein
MTTHRDAETTNDTNPGMIRVIRGSFFPWALSRRDDGKTSVVDRLRGATILQANWLGSRNEHSREVII